jgi:AAA+ ATPase superfamily predicted ATPase
VRSTQTATSAYRQIELLQKPIAALREIQNRLAFNRNAFIATRFGSITQRWLQILQTACRTLTEAAEKSGEIPQPYIAGSALDPEDAKSRFKGRQDLFRAIENLSLSPQPPILLLYGGRRTGKTSTLKYLPQKVGADLVPLLVDIQGIVSTITLSGFAKSLATAIQKAAWNSRRLQLPQPDLEELQTDPFLALQTWFTQIERMASGKRFLLCLDEFERLEELIAATNSRAPLNFLRHVMQHCPRWILLFSGSHTPDELDPYWSDYLINTQSLRLTYLEEPEARELILKPVENFPDIYHPQAVDRIIELTACQPYLVQLTCSLVVDRLNQKSREVPGTTLPSLKATPEDIDGVIPKVLEVGGMYFRELWQLTLSQQERDFIEDLMTGTVEASNQGIIRKLIKKQVIAEVETGNYKVKVPLVKHYFEGVFR